MDAPFQIPEHATAKSLPLTK